MFVPGQKVVCVDDRFPEGIEHLYTALPKKDVLYVIRDIVPSCNYQGEHGEVAVYLAGLVNPVNKRGVERGFNVERFAPLACDRVPAERELAVVEPIHAHPSFPALREKYGEGWYV